MIFFTKKQKLLFGLRKFRYFSSQEWTSNKIRKEFLNFFENNNHEFIKPISLLNKDKNPLLVNAGMIQFKPIFLNNQNLIENENLKNLTKVVNYQKCVRLSGKHNDLDEVGKDFTHHTFFEMLGNWAFNNCYFKEDACKYALNLLTNKFGIDKNKLIVTYFEGNVNLGIKEDIETKEIWKNLGFKDHLIIPLGVKDNFWEMADYGPCGICTEIHYVNNSELLKEFEKKLINENDNVKLMETQQSLLKNCLEIWNLVFIQYEKNKNGLVNLNNKHVDTGMGLERLLAILNNKQSNFDTDLFMPLIKTIEQNLKGATNYNFSLNNINDINYRIVVDHVRAITLLISDNVLPGHTNEGLLIRKLIRRTSFIFRNHFKDKVPKNIFKLLIQQVIENLKEAYPYLIEKEKLVIDTVFSEISWELKSIKSTRKLFTSLLNDSVNNNFILDGKTALTLRKKGALTKEELDNLANQYNFKVDWIEHDQLVEEETKKGRENNLKLKKLKNFSLNKF